MALYSKPVHVLMKEMAEELITTPTTTFTRQDAINWFAQKYPKIRVGTVTAHLTRLSTNARSRIHYNVKPGEDDILYQIDGSHYRRYRPGQDPLPVSSNQTSGENINIPEDEDDNEQLAIEPTVGRSEFAYEKDLRNYLSKNLSLLQTGLKVYEEEGITVSVR